MERRRVARALVVAAVVLIAMTHIALGNQRVRYSVVTVRAGQSLWSIAAGHYPESDPRVTVPAIQRANHLASAMVHSGERLRLPTLPASSS